MPLKDVLDFSVDGDVRVVEAVYRVGSAGSTAEVKISADVIVLVKRRKDAFGLRAVETKIGERNGASIASRNGQVFFDDFAKVHRFRSIRMRPNRYRAR